MEQVGQVMSGGKELWLDELDVRVMERLVGGGSGPDWARAPVPIAIAVVDSRLDRERVGAGRKKLGARATGGL